jgi:hypothetical protein
MAFPVKTKEPNPHEVRKLKVGLHPADSGKTGSGLLPEKSKVNPTLFFKSASAPERTEKKMGFAKIEAAWTNGTY